MKIMILDVSLTKVPFVSSLFSAKTHASLSVLVQSVQHSPLSFEMLCATFLYNSTKVGSGEKNAIDITAV